IAELRETPPLVLLITTAPKFCELLSDHVCAEPPLKVSVRLLGVNVPPVFEKLPPTFRSPPLAEESVSVPVFVTPPRTVSGCIIAGEPLMFIVEPPSIVRLPANWKDTFEEPLGRSRLVLLLSCTLLG